MVLLKRVRVLNVQLGAMKPGQQRRIEGEELEELYELSGCRRSAVPPRIPAQERSVSRDLQRKRKVKES